MTNESLIYVDGFKVSIFPSNPPSVNNEAGPPPLETVGHTNIDMVDSKSQAFTNWVNNAADQMAVYKKWSPFMAPELKIIFIALLKKNADKYPHLSSLYWLDFISDHKTILSPATPPSESIKVVAQFQWKSIGSQNNTTSSSSTFSKETQQGVTNSDSQTNTFAETISASVTGVYEAISATLSASFTKTYSRTHSITISKLSSFKETIPVGSEQFVQVWQLMKTYSAGGNIITLGTQNWQLLSPQKKKKKHHHKELLNTSK